jgi:hypothetical protein
MAEEICLPAGVTFFSQPGEVLFVFSSREEAQRAIGNKKTYQRLQKLAEGKPRISVRSRDGRYQASLDRQAIQPSSLDLLKETGDRSFVEPQDANILFALNDEQELATWLVGERDRFIYGCNKVAADANKKPPNQLIGGNCSELWEEEELARLTSHLIADGAIRDHVNIGYRWQKDGDLYYRSRHEFCVDYVRMLFMGVPVRFEVVKQAIAL